MKRLCFTPFFAVLGVAAPAAAAVTNVYDSATASVITNSAVAGTIIEKVGNGTIVAARPLKGPAFVRAGTLAVHSSCPAYSRYRFMVDSVSTSSGTGLMEMGEFRLLKDGVDVTQGYVSVGSCPDGGGSPDAEKPVKAVDGILANNNKFLDRSLNQGFIDKCYLELVYGSPRSIDAYDWANGTVNNASRFPKTFRLLGSNDGETWDELDKGTSTSSTYLQWQGPFRISNCARSVTVATNATLAVSGTYSVERVVNMGTVSIADNSYLEVTNDFDTVASAGGFTGAGGIVKSGAGTMVMENTNGYTGATRVLGGTLRFGRNGTASAKWLRVTFRNTYRIDLSEWSLFDSAGNRVVTNLTRVSYGLDPRLMGAKTCTMAAAYETGSGETVDKLFDGSTGTKLCLPARSTWATIVLRLADDTPALASYNFTVADQNWNGKTNSPGSWLVEGSEDGETWFKLDDVTNPTYPTDVKSPYNGGVPMVFTQGVDYNGQWLKFTFKKIKGNSSYMALMEIFLLDANCATQNLSVTGVAAGTAAKDLNPGECILFTSDEVTNESGENTPKLFDNSIASNSKFQWKGLAIRETDDASWKAVTLRLPATAVPVAGYQFVAGDQAWGTGDRCPTHWKVEASCDGETWELVDEVANPVMPTASKTPYNGGTPFIFDGGAAVCVSAALPENSALEVVDGAAVEIRDASVVKALTVDMTDGAGSISGFVPAPGGRLNLVNVTSLGAAGIHTLPISITGDLDETAMKSWKVFVNGVERSDVVFCLQDGNPAIRVKSGLCFIVM